MNTIFSEILVEEGGGFSEALRGRDGGCGTRGCVVWESVGSLWPRGGLGGFRRQPVEQLKRWYAQRSPGTSRYEWGGDRAWGFQIAFNLVIYEFLSPVHLHRRGKCYILARKGKAVTSLPRQPIKAARRGTVAPRMVLRFETLKITSPYEALVLDVLLWESTDVRFYVESLGPQCWRMSELGI